MSLIIMVFHRLQLVGLFSLRESPMPTKSVRENAYNVVRTTVGMQAVTSSFPGSPITFTTKPVPNTHYPSQCRSLGDICRSSGYATLVKRWTQDALYV